MGRVSRDARLCYVNLWTVADDAGRLRGNSRLLASLLYPYDSDAPELIDRWLNELEAEACIARYVKDGNCYIQIHKWLEHQKIDRPTASKIPPFVDDSRGVDESSTTDRNGREGIGKDINTCGEPAEPTSPPAVLVFPCVGSGAKEWCLTEAKLAQYRESFPGVDVLSECRSARQWCRDNPQRRKTFGGMASFLSRWLTKAQNKSVVPEANGTKHPPSPEKLAAQARETRTCVIVRDGRRAKKTDAQITAELEAEGLEWPK